MGLLGLAPLSNLMAADGAVAPYAYEIFTIPVFDGFELTVTNSMIMLWLVCLVIVLAIRLAVRKAEMVPGKGQAIVEMIVEGVEGLIEPIVGKKLTRPTFWLLASCFLMILINNWSGLLPGVGTIGLITTDGYGHEHFDYWFRPANADVNTTLALAIIAQSAWLFYVLKFAGLKTLLVDLFGNKADIKDVGKGVFYMLTPIFAFVGIIEVVSIAFRTVSLPFRLFGNIFGGENLLVNMMGLTGVDWLGWILGIPFYFLELLVGLIQALVFTILVAVYIGLICNHESEEGHAH